MATKTIHTLKYQMLVDSAKFEKGMVASRKELNFAKREMNSMLSPAEKMEVSLVKLGELAKKDAKFQDLYNKKLAQYNAHLKNTAKQAGVFHKAFGKSAGVIKNALAVVSVGMIGRSLQTQIDRVDKLAKVSDKLGISTANLTRLQFAAGQTIGLSDDQTVSAIEEMSVNLNKAEHATGRAKLILDKYNISLKNLTRDTPEGTLKAVAEALRKVEDQTDKNVIAGAIFGKQQSGMHVLLSQTNDQLQAQFDRADALGKTVTSFDAAEMVRAKDAMGEMNASFESFALQFATTFGPSITIMLEELSNLLASMPGGSKGEVNRNYSFADFTSGYISSGKGVWSEILSGDFASAMTRSMDPFGDTGLFGEIDMANRDRVKKETERTQAAELQSQQRKDNFEKKKQEEQAAIDKQSALERKETLSRGVGMFLAEGLKDAISNAGAGANRVKGMLGSIEVKQPQQIEIQRRTTDPIQSITAGSSEAFKVLNQTSSIRSVEVDMARKRTENSAKTVTVLDQMLGLMKDGEKSEFANL